MKTEHQTISKEPSQVLANKSSQLHRWFQRTTSYTTEYVLLLFFSLLFLTISTTTIFLLPRFIKLSSNNIYELTLHLSQVLTSELAALLITTLTIVLLYARIKGQESVIGSIYPSRVRRVAKAIWTICVAITIVLTGIIAVSGLMSALLLQPEELSYVLMNSFLPSCISIALLLLVASMILRRLTYKQSMMHIIAVSLFSLVLLVLGIVLIATHHDKSSQTSNSRSRQIHTPCHSHSLKIRSTVCPDTYSQPKSSSKSY